MTKKFYYLGLAMGLAISMTGFTSCCNTDDILQTPAQQQQQQGSDGQGSDGQGSDGTTSGVPVESITLNQTEVTLIVGETFQLEATVVPADATNADVDWDSGDADQSVATIDGAGIITAQGTGTTEFVVKAGDKTATCKVTVKVATMLNNTMTAWTTDAYAVPAGGLTFNDAITVSGNVTLGLTDGMTLTLNKGISLANGATLTIKGNGTMVVNGTSGSTASTVAGSGTIVLTSGTLTAKGGNGANVGGIDLSDIVGNAGGAAINGNVTISGGTLTATGGNGGSGGALGSKIICGDGGAAINGSVTISSGTLNATGGNGGRACYDVDMGDDSDYHGRGKDVQGGAGGSAIGGALTINGGTLTTTDGTDGPVWGSDNKDCSGGAGGKAVGGTTTDNR